MRISQPTASSTHFSKRRKRSEEPGEAREFTFCCYNRFPFLSQDRTRQWFVDALVSARKRHPFDLWAYVIMPDHVHLLVYPRQPNLKLGPVVGEVKEYVGRRAVAYLKKHAPEWLTRIAVREGNRLRHRFWQPGGGFDRNANQIETVHYMINYIHMNPVRRGFVAKPEDWYWSSAAWYAGQANVPIELDRTVPMRYLNKE